MKWFSQCLGFFQKKKVTPEEYTIGTYKSAGTLFTNGTHVLAGYQPNKKSPFISGIGGTKNKGESYMHTAIRETIEELFEVKIFPYKLMYDIITTIKPIKVILNTVYVIVVFTFEDLNRILELAQKHNISSPLYTNHPTNLMELIFQRIKYKQAEISHLVLLPVTKKLCIDCNFINDLERL